MVLTEDILGLRILGVKYGSLGCNSYARCLSGQCHLHIHRAGEARRDDDFLAFGDGKSRCFNTQIVRPWRNRRETIRTLLTGSRGLRSHQRCAGDGYYCFGHHGVGSVANGTVYRAGGRTLRVEERQKGGQAERRR